MLKPESNLALVCMSRTSPFASPASTSRPRLSEEPTVSATGSGRELPTLDMLDIRARPPLGEDLSLVAKLPLDMASWKIYP
jgi:hypothetical protein